MLEHIGNEVKYKENREKRSMTEYKRLGDYIREVNVRNQELKVTNLLGLSVSKEFIPSIANTIGTDMSAYKVVERNQLVYIADTSRRGDKIAIGLLDKYDKAIVSQAYTVFEVVNHKQLLPEFLMMWFRRPEFDRYARFHSHGSAREIFDWDELCDVMLPIPSITRKENLPEGWRMGTLAEIAEIKNGKAILPNGGNIAVYGGNGIVGYTNDSNAEGVVVIGRVGINCGSLYLNQSSCYVNDNAMMAIPKDGNTIFLYRTLMEMDLNSQSEGSGQPLLTQSIIYKQECLIPKQEQCIEFEEQMRIVYKQKYLIEQENEKLTELQSLLLAKMGQ